jgi:hypothetical protein
MAVQQRRVSDLVAVNTATSNNLLMIVVNANTATANNRKITVSNFFGNVSCNINSSFNITTTSNINTNNISVTNTVQTSNTGTVFSGRIRLVDGVSAPTTVVGEAQIYVDSADGNLKVKFGDGVIKTIATGTA